MADVIYTSNDCGYCSSLKASIVAAGLADKIVELNIDINPLSRLAFAQTQSRTVPTAVINDIVFIGAPTILAALRAKHGTR